MKFFLLCDRLADFFIEEKGETSAQKIKKLSDVLDHAVLNKKDVKYTEKGNFLELELQRNLYEEKRKNFLGFNIWLANRYPTKKCILTIKNIINITVRDEDPDNPDRDHVVIGGISISEKNDIYVGSFCEYENPFGITLKVKSIDITLEDM